MSMRLLVTGLLASSFLFLSGWASSAMKQRKDQREKVAQTSKLYCEFINGELFPDIDVALNLEMAKRCDSDKNFTITQYKTPSENMGVMYCCVPQQKMVLERKSEAAKPDIKSESKSELKVQGN